MRRLFGLIAAIGLLGAPVAAQSVPLRDLPKPEKEIDDPFSFVTALLELRDGKVIVVDGLEAAVAVVNFSSGDKEALGRQGAGPGEYRLPIALFRLQGDTVWLMDAGQQRVVAFNPDLKPGTTFPFLVFDQGASKVLSAPFFADRSGRVYASSMSMQGAQIGRTGGAMVLPDSVGLVRLDPRDRSVRTELASIRFPTSGKPEMKIDGTNMKYTMAYPGLVASDPWTVFPDGRVAIVRGASYTVEFIAPDGKRSAPVRIAYERFKVTEADRKAEMDEAREQMGEQTKAMKKMMPPNVNLVFDLLPPERWPDEYPPVSPLAAMAAPDGRLWVKRAVPVRQGRDQWDVIDQSGKLVARWRLPPKVNIVGLGNGAVYTVRKDEDDLRYVQRVVLPR